MERKVCELMGDEAGELGFIVDSAQHAGADGKDAIRQDRGVLAWAPGKPDLDGINTGGISQAIGQLL